MTRATPDPPPVTVLDLFAGCGGLTEGFHQFRPAGANRPVFRSVGAVEWEPSAAASYAMNFGMASERAQGFDPPEIYCRDMVGWQPRWEPGEIDVVVGGPPCQGFSGLNRNKVRAERNELWQEFIRVVIAVQPRVFVIENVDRFVRSPEFADLKRRMGNGDLTNYRLVAPPGTRAADTDQQRARRYLLNAADYGARQARRRAIVIGVRTGIDLRIDRMQYPGPTHSRGALQHREALAGLAGPAAQQAWLTVDALFSVSDEMALIATELPERSTRAPGIDGTFAGPYTTSELHITRSPEAVSLARYEAIPRGGNRKNLRGRYLCRFDDGGRVLLERNGRFRDDTGKLIVFGGYSEVVDGVATGREVSVVALEPERVVRERGGRNRSEAFSVVVRDGEQERYATLEYLSTPVWDGHDAGSGDVMGRIREGAPSVTIRTEFFKPEKGRYLHPSRHRPITHYEAARLQGFPEDFRWCGSKTDIAKQIGNAVPIPLGTKIAEAIYAYLRPGD